MATAAQVAEFRSNISDLVTLAINDLTQFWEATSSADPIVLRDALLEFYPDLVTVYGDTAALLGADFYDELRDVPSSAARFAAVLAEPTDTERAEAVARWGIGPLFAAEPNPNQALENLLGATQRLVVQPARSTVAVSARRDNVRTAFARVPSGAETCRWCLMLASRGAVYGDSKAAGGMDRYHSWCDCIPTPVRSKRDLPEGYDPAALYSAYQSGL
jgi:hypothetical protein